ncbi:PIN domain-containing protein [Vibrio breoganii]
MSALQEMGNRAEYIKISSHSSNAQYFHMAFYIGKIAASEPDSYFYIRHSAPHLGINCFIQLT